MADALLIVGEMEMPKVSGRGRKKGSGPNLALLRRLLPDGNPVFDVPYDKMQSIRASAWKHGIKLRIRQMIDINNKPTGLYVIQKRK